jgi:hypothetical protein
MIIVGLEYLGCDVVRSADDRILFFGFEFLFHVLVPLESKAKVDKFQVEGLGVEKG